MIFSVFVNSSYRVFKKRARLKGHSDHQEWPKNKSRLFLKSSRNFLSDNQNKSSYFRVKLKKIKFELYTEPDLDQT